MNAHKELLYGCFSYCPLNVYLDFKNRRAGSPVATASDPPSLPQEVSQWNPPALWTCKIVFVITRLLAEFYLCDAPLILLSHW